MNTDHPADIAPLSYGAGLALGLMLIIGLPADRTAAKENAKRPRCLASDAPKVEVPIHRAAAHYTVGS